MGYSHHTEQWLPYPVEAVFAFFTDPDNLPALMPAWQRARMESVSLFPPIPRIPSASAASTAAAAGNGTRISLTFRPFRWSPFRVRWEAEITDFSWNCQFCDRQLHGPFARWNHYHRLRAFDRQGIDMTLIVDHVEYQLPFGFLGRLAHYFFVRRQIEAAFDYRQSQITRIFALLMQESGRPQPQSERQRQQQKKSA